MSIAMRTAHEDGESPAVAMSAFVDAAGVDQIPAGTGTTVKVAGKDVAIFNVDGEIHAIDDTCVHAGASLGSGRLEGKIVKCPAHGLRYDVTTGLVTTGGLGVASYPVKIVDGRILISVE
jgi:nitrite reductase/ring-hydroxylating ferredoxin subunit